MSTSHYKWKDVEILVIEKDELDLMLTFYNEMKNREKFFKLDIVPAEDKIVANIPQVIMLPTLLGPVFVDENKTAWELYVNVKAWLAP